MWGVQCGGSSTMVSTNEGRRVPGRAPRLGVGVVALWLHSDRPSRLLNPCLLSLPPKPALSRSQDVRSLARKNYSFHILHFLPFCSLKCEQAAQEVGFNMVSAVRREERAETVGRRGGGVCVLSSVVRRVPDGRVLAVQQLVAGGCREPCALPAASPLARCGFVAGCGPRSMSECAGRGNSTMPSCLWLSGKNRCLIIFCRGLASLDVPESWDCACGGRCLRRFRLPRNG